MFPCGLKKKKKRTILIVAGMKTSMLTQFEIGSCSSEEGEVFPVRSWEALMRRGERLALLQGHVPGPGTPEIPWPSAPTAACLNPGRGGGLKYRSLVTPNQVPVQDAESFHARLHVPWQ